MLSPHTARAGGGFPPQSNITKDLQFFSSRLLQEQNNGKRRSEPPTRVKKRKKVLDYVSGRIRETKIEGK
jgi:hypothetical protein